MPTNVPREGLQLSHPRRPGRIERVVQRVARGVGGSAPHRAGKPDPAAPREALNAIGLRTGTDKSSAIHDYLHVYEQQLGHLRDKEFQLVEIGVHKGSSTRMWAEYFARAQVVGIDIDPACKELESDRIRVIIGNQGSRAFLNRMARKLRPLVLIDDGSHRWNHQIDTFRALFPVVRAGGYFIVEDIHTSFGEDYARAYGRPGAETAYDYFAEIARGIVAARRGTPPRDDFERYCRDTIESIVFLKNSLVIRKRRFRQRVYRAASVSTTAGESITTDAGPTYPRLPAELVNAGPEVTGAFQGLLEAGPVSFPAATTAVVDDVTTVSSGLALHRGLILEETLNAARNIRRPGVMYRPTDGSVWVNARPLGRPVRMEATPGRHLVLLRQTWDSNYGHWLIDNLPKLALVREIHDLADCDFVVNEPRSEAMRQVMLDSLALAGVTEEQLRYATTQAHHFPRVTIPGTISQHPVAKAPIAIRYLEEIASAVEPAAAPHIYVSRNLGTRRRLLNEDDVLAVLEPFGYQRVDPETLTLREQVALFRGASHVVGNLGAGLSNLAFSPADVRVLALATQAMEHDFFYDIVCHKPAGRYDALQGRTEDEHPSLSSDFTVDVDLLRERLDRLHS